MRISSSDTIAGHPILQIRRLLAKGQADDLVAWDVERSLAVDTAEARRVLILLEHEGYLELYMDYLPNEQWRTTLKGNTLAQASAARPISRAKAEQRLAEFLARVEQLNADDTYVYRVSKAALFGSMLGESPVVGDIDVAIQLTPRYDGEALTARREQRIADAATAGRSFANLMDRLMWPYREVVLFLRNRSRVLSIHEFNDLVELETPYQMLFGE
jgi:predicted nucleotidyltransferase